MKYTWKTDGVVFREKEVPVLEVKPTSLEVEFDKAEYAMAVSTAKEVLAFVKSLADATVPQLLAKAIAAGDAKEKYYEAQAEYYNSLRREER